MTMIMGGGGASKAYVDAQLAESMHVTDITFNGVLKGIEVTNSGGLNCAITEGIAYLNGTRIEVPSSQNTLTALRDTYVDLSNTGVITYVAVANGAAEPAITADSIRIGILITDATSITEFYRYTRNVALGEGAYENNTHGYDNVAIGFQAMRNNTTGHRNVAVGVAAMLANTTGHHNIAFGQNALLSNTTGIYNTALGIDALHDNVDGTYNIAIGQYAMLENTGGDSNVAIGISALANNLTGNGNIAMGQYALTTQDLAVSNNTAIGTDAFRFNQSGTYLVGFGYAAGRANTDGVRNHFIGYESGYANTSGDDNVGLGYATLHANNTFNNNTAVGSYALFGCQSASNVAVGFQSLYQVTSGEKNTGLGLQAGYKIITGSNNTFVGFGTGGSASQTATDIVNSTAIGSLAVINESNAMQLGDTAVTKVYSHGSFECQDIGDGFICKSPDGTRYRITVANGGTISIAAA